MMKSSILVVVAVVGLMACTPRIVPAVQGIGFDDPALRAEREAALSTPQGTIIPPARITLIPSQSPSGQGATGPNLGNDPFRTQGLDASPSNPAPALANVTSLSDEQDFGAVTGRETIESDAERRAAQVAVREQVTPTEIPDRPRNVGPNIVAYALNATNTLGQELYSRSVLNTESRFRRNCALYPTTDDAQRDFLARGGPERDRLGLDPDGDGFACGWDPAPFIVAFQN